MSQPYALTDSTLVIAERFFDILTAQKAVLGLQDVWFGDQTNTPRTPCICVEPGTERRTLDGIPDMTTMYIDTTFFLYHSRIDETQKNRRDCIKFAKDVQHFLHLNHIRLYSDDAQTAQLTVHGFCVDFDPGYRYRQGTLFNAVSMTWSSLTKVSLQRQF